MLSRLDSSIDVCHPRLSDTEAQFTPRPCSRQAAQTGAQGQSLITMSSCKSPQAGLQKQHTPGWGIVVHDYNPSIVEAEKGG
jgi:hypothetical protein